MDERNDYNSIPMKHTQTAMQELINELESINSYPMMPLILRLMKDKLDKEKQQMLESSISGSKGDSFEQYYNQTYNKT